MRTRRTDGAAIRARRTAEGFTQTGLARRCRISASYLREIEHGRLQPSDRILSAITRGLRCCLDDVSTPLPVRDAA